MQSRAWKGLVEPGRGGPPTPCLGLPLPNALGPLPFPHRLSRRVRSVGSSTQISQPHTLMGKGERSALPLSLCASCCPIKGNVPQKRRTPFLYRIPFSQGEPFPFKGPLLLCCKCYKNHTQTSYWLSRVPKGMEITLLCTKCMNAWF